MKKVLITGCNGLVGSKLVSELTTTGNYEIIGVGRNKQFLHDTAIIDLSENWSSSDLPQNIDIIIHLAQSELFRDFPNSAEKVFNVNTVSTLKLLEYGRKAGATRFIYASSGGIYGNSDDYFAEDNPVSMRNDLGFYLSTKFCSELLVQNYSSFFNIDILRFFFVYGKEQRQDMLIPRLIKSIKTNTPITLQGTDGIKINPIYVGDAVKALINCFTLEGSNHFNIAGSEIFTLREICDIIGRTVGISPNYIIEPVEPKNLIADILKMKTLLGTPEVNFTDALKLML